MPAPRGGLVDDRLRVVAGLLALAGAAVGVALLAARAAWLGERDVLLLAVRLVLPGLLALGGHLIARRTDVRGPVLLVTLGLLLAPALSVDLLRLVRTGASDLLSVGAPVQHLLGVSAGALAWLRTATVGRVEATLGRLGGFGRATLVGVGVLLALAELYPSVTGPLVGPLQPLLAVLGANAWPTVLAAGAVVLVVVLAARVPPAAGAGAVAALALVTLGQTALLLREVLGGQVVAAPWLWVRLLGGLVLGGLAVHVGRISRADGAATGPGRPRRSADEPGR